MTAPDADIAVVLLAAGSSTRFAGDKLTADFRGLPLWQWAAVSAEEAGFTNRFIVVSQDSLLATRFGWTRVINTHAGNGMGSSIAAGVVAANRYSRILIMLADMPFVSPAHLLRLAQAQGTVFTEYPERRRGCPAAFPRSTFAQLGALSGDEGARHLLIDGTRTISPPDPSHSADLDTRTDFARFSDL